MQRFITDERTGIRYELIGDYYYPCLTAEEKPLLSKYGRMTRAIFERTQASFILHSADKWKVI